MPTPSFTAEQETEQRVQTVSQLTAQFKNVVEREFPAVWVAGEISNFSRPQSGHCYFTLKDDTAQIRGVLWRGTAARIKFDLHDGLEVICQGRLDVYPPRGSYQLVVERMEPQGIGSLELALRKLREKLGQEGLFDADRKQPLPKFPRRIAVVTSPTGAAIRDFLEVLRRRWRGMEVLIIPVAVQGDTAAGQIAEGIRLANQIEPRPDVLVVGRGGGSVEDLWAFNEELVVRAIAASHIPTVSAVGHEIDVTLSDLAADVRALTPTEAAELVVPSAQGVAEWMHSLSSRMRNVLVGQVATHRSRLDAIASRPAFARPLDGVHHLSRQADDLATRLHGAIQVNLREQQNQVAAISGKLETLSPLAVLRRGYSLTQDPTTDRLITSTKSLKKGQQIATRLAEGNVLSTIDTIES